MNLAFPSPDFDEVVAAVCHGTVSEGQAAALRELLRRDGAARDEYLRRVALHTYLASETDLFANAATATPPRLEVLNPPAFSDVASCRVDLDPRPRPATASRTQIWAIAAGVVVLLGALGVWLTLRGGEDRRRETSRAVAMLNRVVNARWASPDGAPRLGAPLEPGRVRLESGLVQIVFYQGARVVIEGPAELQLVSSSEAVCVRGRLTAEVPPQARGFRVTAPRLEVTDRGTAFGLEVGEQHAEIHVFEGRVEFRAAAETAVRQLPAGQGALVEGSAAPRMVAADRGKFAGLFDLQEKSIAAEAQAYDHWRKSLSELQSDPSLWVHLDFEHGGEPVWRLPNRGSLGDRGVAEATIVGCEWREGRWNTKPALEFRSISDRVRMDVAGELESVTLAAWVRVQGLDRQINSLFMSDGFRPGTLHWVIRHDGVLGLTVIGSQGQHQILASPPVMEIGQFGIWTHLAVVMDARARRVVHFVNGRPVSQHALRVEPPFQIGAAELGNWNAHGFPGHDPFLVRNFSGAMDEFCLFNRALSADEVQALHAAGRPQSGSLASADSPSPHLGHPSCPTLTSTRERL